MDPVILMVCIYKIPHEHDVRNMQSNVVQNSVCITKSTSWLEVTTSHRYLQRWLLKVTEFAIRDNISTVFSHIEV